ncbi:MAG: GerAB/ArcD/ProY family transporter [Clostridia bacterium]|nr:GerAB/ArcD/ProY family transporter [Clostridia bacterium]
MHHTFEKPFHSPLNERVVGRQIALFAAFVLPATKLLEAPSILAKYAMGDLLVPALLHFLLQAGILAVVLFVVSRSEITLFERLQHVLKKGVIVLYLLYALYFLFAILLPLLDLEKYAYAAFFDTAPTTFSFLFFFFLSAFICAKGMKAVGRFSDLCLFLFLFSFVALLTLSVPETDFTHLLPFFGTKFQDTMCAFKYTTPHFSDTILLLPLLGNYQYKKKDAPKIMLGYAIGALCTLFFLAVFYGIFSSVAPREHYAFSKIAQYFPALSVIGRIDLLFVYLLSIVLFFYTALPAQYATHLFSRACSFERKAILSAILNFGLFLFVFFCNKYYNAFYRVIGGKLLWIFWLFADIFPLLLLLLPNGKKTKNASTKENVNA